MHTLILYIKNGCPWCKKIIDFADVNDVVFEQLKEKNEPGVLEDLLNRGGKSQFPYLVDETADIEMYESGDIIEYLKALPKA
jgi:glutaredoxin